jgi:hypothetical protein
MYNLIHDINPAVYTVLPMLGKKPSEYPRFRDCFLMPKHWGNMDGLPVVKYQKSAEKLTIKDVIANAKIYIFTRAGGRNRFDYQQEISDIRNMPDFVSDYDDQFDSTYATFVFNVPERFKADFVHLLSSEFSQLSAAYKETIYNVWPNQAEDMAKFFADPNSRSTVKGE